MPDAMEVLLAKANNFNYSLVCKILNSYDGTAALIYGWLSISGGFIYLKSMRCLCLFIEKVQTGTWRCQEGWLRSAQWCHFHHRSQGFQGHSQWCKCVWYLVIESKSEKWQSVVTVIIVLLLLLYCTAEGHFRCRINILAFLVLDR